MIYVPIPSTVRVELIFRQDNQTCQNVFHVRTPNAINAQELDNIQLVIQAWYEADLSPNQHQSVSLIKYVLTDASTQNGVGKEYGPGLVYQGGYTLTPALPNSVTIAVRWNTGLRGRSYRGRTYHIGLGEGMVVANSVYLGDADGLRTLYTSLLTMLDIANYELVVASKFLNNAPRFVGVATQILTATVEPTIDTQRRRLPGKGS